jgi:hypothetical protein
MMRALRVKCSKDPLLTVKRSKQAERHKRLVYILTAKKPQSYTNGKSRIIYIGTTGKAPVVQRHRRLIRQVRHLANCTGSGKSTLSL